MGRQINTGVSGGREMNNQTVYQHTEKLPSWIYDQPAEIIWTRSTGNRDIRFPPEKLPAWIYDQPAVYQHMEDKNE